MLRLGRVSWAQQACLAVPLHRRAGVSPHPTDRQPGRALPLQDPSNAQETGRSTQFCAPGGLSATTLYLEPTLRPPDTLAQLRQLCHTAPQTKSQHSSRGRGRGKPVAYPVQGLEASSAMYQQTMNTAWELSTSEKNPLRCFHMTHQKKSGGSEE